MGNFCGLDYGSKKKKGILNFVNSLWRNMPPRDRVIEQVRKVFGTKELQINIVDFDENEIIQSLFKKDVLDEICHKDGNDSDNLSVKAREIYSTMMEAFFTRKSVENTLPLVDTDMENDEEFLERRKRNLDESVSEIYGIDNVLLLRDLQEQFDKELISLLIYDSSESKSIQLTKRSLNERIVKYKESKFNSILQLLKNVYKHDDKLLNINSYFVYDEDNKRYELNVQNYYYVINKFKEYLKSQNVDLTEELNEKILKKYEAKQKVYLTNLINFALKNEDFAKWFNNKYNSEASRDRVLTNLFTGASFSRDYLDIKSKLNKLILLEKIDSKIVQNYINAIENPNNSILQFVHDFVSLVYFDDLAMERIPDLKISYGFERNVELISPSDLKYELVDGHKHQKTGFENSQDDDAINHTSKKTLIILSSLTTQKHNEDHENIPDPITMSVLILAWQALCTDILENSIALDSQTEIANFNKIKDILNTLQKEDPVDNIRYILDMIFNPHGMNGGKPWIEKFKPAGKKELKLSDYHKSILYSFFKQVIDTSEPNSIYSILLEALNGDGPTNYMDVVIDLCRILYNNVNNNYADVDLLANKFEVKSQTNWDGELMNIVEGCNFYLSRLQLQLNYDESDLDIYSSYNSDGNTVTSKITLKDKNEEDVDLGYTYQMYNKHSQGLFSDGRTLNLLGKETLDKLANVDLNDFGKKILLYLGQEIPKDILTSDEYLLKLLLDIIQKQLKLSILSDAGLKTLETYKQRYKADYKAGLPSSNYLEHFLRLALRSLEINNEIYKSKLEGKSWSQYCLDPLNKYSDFIKSNNSLYVSRAYGKVYLNAMTTKDKALSDFAKYYLYNTGKSIKSTTMSKQRTTMSNYSISRAGSELNRRIKKALDNPKDVANGTNIYLQNPDSIKCDPVIFNELRTLSGDVKAIRDATAGELMQHAMFDKFYSWIGKHGDKFMIQMATYADKTTFLNYESDLTPFGGIEVLNLTNDTRGEFVKKYSDTFFALHSKILGLTVEKFKKIILFKTGEFNQDNAYNVIKAYLNSRNKLQVMSDLIEFNKSLKEKRNQKRNLENKQELSLSEQKILDLLNSEDLKDLELVEDLDFRDRRGSCDLNEIVEFYSELKLSPEKLNEYILNQEKIFADHIKEYGIDLTAFNFEDEFNSWLDGSFNPNTVIGKALSNTAILSITDRKKYAEQWMKDGQLIIQKDGRLNPFFEKFFFIEGIASNNLRLLGTGTEANHPDKSDNLFKQLKSLIEEYDKNKSLENFNKIFDKLSSERIIINDNSESKSHIEQYNKNKAITENIINKLRTINSVNKLNEDSELLQIYKLSLLDIINTALTTQYKRDVIIPATLHHPMASIYGIADECIVACAKDMKAPVNNLRESDTIDSLDGSAEISAIWQRLENYSLGELKVGVNRKPIWDDQNEQLSSFLAKFAAFAPTNSSMLLSLQSDSSLYMMFKKMHNLRWNKSIDITNSINKGKDLVYNDTECNKWFRNKILGGEKLFYKDALTGDIVAIIGFGKDANGDYFTKEVRNPTFVNNPDGTTSVKEKGVKVYHFFDENSNHYTENDGTRHTIDSLYELFVSLGGIHSVNEDGSISDRSLDVLTGFVTNVGYKTKTKIQSDRDVYLPLKKLFVAYVFNSSAVKNGARNMNENDVWTDPNKELNTFTLSTSGLGILLNADHDVAESEMTEFSQVIAACSAYGKTFENVAQIYYSLGLSALEESKEELDIINEFLRRNKIEPKKAKSKLYTFIAEQIIKSKSNSEFDISTKVKKYVERELSVKCDDRSKDELKIPFSDLSLYVQFISAITSTINKKSIKRKHPGSQYVMVPGYNVVQLYNLNLAGKYRKYTTQDIINKGKHHFAELLRNAIKQVELSRNEKFKDTRFKTVNGKTVALNKLSLSGLIEEAKVRGIKSDYLNTNLDDLVLFEKHIINTYLGYIQKGENWHDKEWFMPTDIVNIYNERGLLIGTHNLDDMQDYYKFKNGIYELQDSVQDEFKVKITHEGNNIFVTLNEAAPEGEKATFWLEKDGNEYHLHFRTGGFNDRWLRRTKSTLTKLQKDRLFNAALALVPDGSVISIKPTESNELGVGGLTAGSTVAYETLLTTPDRLLTTNLEATGDTVDTIAYITDNDGATKFNPDGSPMFITKQIPKFRKTSNKPFKQVKYKLNVTKPYNLKPSLIRWKYIGDDLQEHYMTIYDHPIIRNSWNKPKDLRPTLAEIQQILDNIMSKSEEYPNGFFEMNGKKYGIIEGSLENTKAELVMGNMYKNTFGIGNETLAEILDLKEAFFNKLNKVLSMPDGQYHFSFVKPNGKLTLISIGNMLQDINSVENPFKKEYVNDYGEIYDKEGGIKIGKYIDSDWTQDENGIVKNKDGEVVSEDKYRIHEGKVQEKVEFVKRYTVISKDNNLTKYYTLYNIVQPSEILRALDDVKDSSGKKIRDKNISDALVLSQAILKKIYLQDNYFDIYFKYSNVKDDKYRNHLGRMLDQIAVTYNSETKQEMSDEEIAKLSRKKQHLIALKKMLLSEKFDEKAYSLHIISYNKTSGFALKKYSSFINSLDFIASRIPAQSLQSFMPMECVAWTGDTGNTAYVSYILTYLLGSKINKY